MRTTILAVLAALSWAVVPIFAACPSVKRVQVQQVAVPVLAYAIPTYGASYGQQSPELVDLLRRILDTLERLERKIDGQQAAMPPAPVNAVALFEGSCLKCHQSNTAEKQGGGLVLFETDAEGKGGTLAPLSLEQKKRIKTRVEVARNMPPGKPLDPLQAKSLVEWLTANKEKQ